MSSVRYLDSYNHTQSRQEGVVIIWKVEKTVRDFEDFLSRDTFLIPKSKDSWLLAALHETLQYPDQYLYNTYTWWVCELD